MVDNKTYSDEVGRYRPLVDKFPDEAAFPVNVIHGFGASVLHQEDNLRREAAWMHGKDVRRNVSVYLRSPCVSWSEMAQYFSQQTSFFLSALHTSFDLDLYFIFL